MAVPDYQAYMTPMLQLLSDGQARHINDIADQLAQHFRLTEEDLRDMIPSGRKSRHYDRVGWAAVYLKQAELLDKPARGWYALSMRGFDVVRSGDQVNTEYLCRFPEFAEFRVRRRDHGTGAESTAQEPLDAFRVQHTPEENIFGYRTLPEIFHEQTAEENIRAGYHTLLTYLSADLLERVKAAPPKFFEELVVDLLVAMGYGGSRAEAGQRVGQSGDDGIDGIINEDRLGLDVVYIQAKRWNSSVGSATVREFSGSLDMQGARKGVLITTGTFTKDAIDTVNRLPKKIVLIDGERLTQLMIEFNIGVSVRERLEIKKIDEDYFSGE